MGDEFARRLMADAPRWPSLVAEDIIPETIQTTMEAVVKWYETRRDDDADTLITLENKAVPQQCGPLWALERHKNPLSKRKDVGQVAHELQEAKKEGAVDKLFADKGKELKDKVKRMMKLVGVSDYIANNIMRRYLKALDIEIPIDDDWFGLLDMSKHQVCVCVCCVCCVVCVHVFFARTPRAVRTPPPPFFFTFSPF